MNTPQGKFILFAILTLVGIQSGMALLIYLALPNWAERGQFGDMFGVINTLFSGLAFAGVIYAILLQREDLELQREELKLTRQELKRSAEAQEKSERALTAQANASEKSTKLSAVNYLLDYYSNELKSLRGIVYTGNDPRAKVKAELESRHKQLLELLDEVFHDATSREK